jgi:hypothetical protein
VVTANRKAVADLNPAAVFSYGGGRGGMTTAIEQIVDTYVRLRNRQKLEDLRMHRQRMAIHLEARMGYDLSLPLRQVEDEIAAIEAGLKRLAEDTQAA